MTALELAARLRAHVGTTRPEATQSSALVKDILESLAISPPELARHLELAPQTINRWRKGEIVPRPRQAQRLEAWLQQQQPNLIEISPSNAHDLNSLGIRLSAEILHWEADAKAVWIVKSGVLREAARGTIGETVLRGLQNGAHFNYVFLRHSPASESFQRLSKWLQTENFTGNVTGFEISDYHLASAIGLTEVSGAWIGIEYSPDQVAILKRRFDVFFAVSVREYSDARRTDTKNEDGQPCWMELATPQAARWLEALNNLCAELSGNPHQKQAHISFLPAR